MDVFERVVVWSNALRGNGKRRKLRRSTWVRFQRQAQPSCLFGLMGGSEIEKR